MRTAQEMPARANLAQRIHRLGILVNRHTRRQMVQHAKLIRIKHEFLRACGQAALKPTASMQHEIHARQQTHIQRI